MVEKKQRAAPIARPLRPAKELAAMVKRLPKEERLRLEGIVLGMGIARQGPPTSPPA